MEYAQDIVLSRSMMMEIESCPDCGGFGCLSHEGGCAVCLSCGWSPCK